MENFLSNKTFRRLASSEIAWLPETCRSSGHQGFIMPLLVAKSDNTYWNTCDLTQWSQVQFPTLGPGCQIKEEVMISCNCFPDLSQWVTERDRIFSSLEIRSKQSPRKGKYLGANLRHFMDVPMPFGIPKSLRRSNQDNGIDIGI